MARRKKQSLAAVPAEVEPETEQEQEATTLPALIRALVDKTMPLQQFEQMLDASPYDIEIDSVKSSTHHTSTDTFDMVVQVAVVNREDDGDQDFATLALKASPYGPDDIDPNDVLRVWFGALPATEDAGEAAAEAAMERTKPNPPAPVDPEEFEREQLARGKSLAELVREEQDVLAEKAASNAEFNDRLKKIRESMRKTAEVINTRQRSLFAQATA